MTEIVGRIEGRKRQCSGDERNASAQESTASSDTSTRAAPQDRTNVYASLYNMTRMFLKRLPKPLDANLWLFRDSVVKVLKACMSQCDQYPGRKCEIFSISSISSSLQLA